MSESDLGNKAEVSLHEDSVQHPAYEEYQRRLEESTDVACFDPRQLPQLSRKLKLNYHELAEEVNSNKQHLLSPESAELSQIIDRSSNIYQQVRKPQEAVVDSSLLSLSADVAGQKASLLAKSASRLYSLQDFLISIKCSLKDGEEALNVSKLGQISSLISNRAEVVSALYRMVQLLDTFPLSFRKMQKRKKRQEMSAQS